MAHVTWAWDTPPGLPLANTFFKGEEPILLLFTVYIFLIIR